MKKLSLEIKPKEGYGELNFGETTEVVISLLGDAEEVEDIADDEEFNTVILNYWDKGVSIFMEGVEKSVVACFETENEESTMYGKKIFAMDEKAITDLMTSKKFEVAETEMEEDNIKRVSYDDAMIDFFFEGKELVAVNWGVLVNEKGEIEEMPA